MLSLWRRPFPAQRSLGKRRQQVGARRKLEFERFEDRTLLDSGLGQIAGLTDTPQARFITGLYYDLLYRVPPPADHQRADKLAPGLAARGRPQRGGRRHRQ